MVGSHPTNSCRNSRVFEKLPIFYPHRGWQLTPWQVGGAALLLAALTGLAVVLRRRRPALLVGWL